MEHAATEITEEFKKCFWFFCKLLSIALDSRYATKMPVDGAEPLDGCTLILLSIHISIR
jgi:hypothetical protein